MEDLDPVCKKPFVRFLLWVYMNTGGDIIITGSIMLFHDWYVCMLTEPNVHCLKIFKLLGKCGVIWSIQV